MDRITEKTLVPISLMIAISGGIIWLSAMWFRGESTASEVNQFKSEYKLNQKEQSDLAREILQRLSRIEEAVKKGR